MNEAPNQWGIPNTRMAELFNAMVGAYETFAEPLTGLLCLAIDDAKDQLEWNITGGILQASQVLALDEEYLNSEMEGFR